MSVFLSNLFLAIALPTPYFVRDFSRFLRNSHFHRCLQLEINAIDRRSLKVQSDMAAANGYNRG